MTLRIEKTITQTLETEQNRGQIVTTEKTKKNFIIVSIVVR